MTLSKIERFEQYLVNDGLNYDDSSVQQLAEELKSNDDIPCNKIPASAVIKESLQECTAIGLVQTFDKLATAFQCLMNYGLNLLKVVWV